MIPVIVQLALDLEEEAYADQIRASGLLEIVGERLRELANRRELTSEFRCAPVRVPLPGGSHIAYYVSDYRPNSAEGKWRVDHYPEGEEAQPAIEWEPERWRVESAG